jgi:O-acetyl-ADP-ribose deacetylase (regulator of RNase III)
LGQKRGRHPLAGLASVCVHVRLWAEMPALFVKGDIFAEDAVRAYAHGCNCAGAMGAGIAIEFKRRWPRMFEEYALRCADKRFGMGDVFVWSEGEHTIYNLGTQAHWRKKAQIPALARSLAKMLELAAHAGIGRVGLPRIGAGLGGLDWARVKRVIAEAGAKSTVTMVVFEQFVRASPSSLGQ